MDLDEERSLQKQAEYTTRVFCSNFGCCCPQEGKRKSAQTTKCELRTRVTKFIEVDGGVLEHLF